jgi:hypothetical protein
MVIPPTQKNTKKSKDETWMIFFTFLLHLKASRWRTYRVADKNQGGFYFYCFFFLKASRTRTKGGF